MSNRKKKKNKTLRFFSGFFLTGFALVIIATWLVFRPVVLEKSEAEERFLYISSGDGYADLLQSLKKEKVLNNTLIFNVLSRLVSYDKEVKAGRYPLKKGMSVFTLLRVLKGGKNLPLELVINNIEIKEELSALLGEKLEPDSLAFIRVFNDEKTAMDYGFSTETFVLMVIPNTYEFYWNTSVMGFLDRMKKEYEKFWTEDRQKKALRHGLSQTEIAILASIVQQESNIKEELSTIAGVYLNRLRSGMKLQADPTVSFIHRNKNLKRIRKKHTESDSPYNTYQNYGLPPGPIALPEIFAIDAVLDAEEHNYLYFCAKSDLSGYHHFSRSYEQHKRYARQYRVALNKKNIR